MQYAERLPNPKSMVAPVVALAIGAAAATGAYALIDSDQVNLPEPQVIVSETPAPTSEGLAAKDEAATAAAISQAPTNSFGKDEAATAAAISQAPTNSFGKDEAATAAAIGAGVTSTGSAVGIPSPAAAAKMNDEVGSGTASKDEAATAAAISQSNDIEHRGSKASATGTSSPSSEDEPLDPHANKSYLHAHGQ
jgi:hypothetical protein